MSIWTSACGRAMRQSARGLICSALASGLLAGCGSSSKNEELEARIAAAEAKADAADKRSQQALSLAASGSSSVQLAPEPEVVVGDSGIDDSGLTDNSGDSGAYDNVIEAPQIPPG